MSQEALAAAAASIRGSKDVAIGKGMPVTISGSGLPEGGGGPLGIDFQAGAAAVAAYKAGADGAAVSSAARKRKLEQSDELDEDDILKLVDEAADVRLVLNDIIHFFC